MANTVIQLKHSTLTGNVPASLANGEISINSRDGKFFYSTPAGVVVTHYPYPGPAGLNQEVQFNDSGVLGSDSGLTYNKTTDALTVAGQLLGSTLKSTQSSGDEGGQIDLSTAATNQSLSGGSVAIDIYQNRLRIFETGGTNRGVYIDMANGATAGVGTDLLSPSSSTDGWARGQANAAFIQANTPSHVANSAASYANSGFAVANSGASYANSAFLSANNSAGVNLTQNTNITNAGTYANSAFGKANTAAVAANTPSHVANSAASYANSAFARANNSLDANNGGTVTGTITATSFITTGSYGNILGANTIYANNFVANTGFIQFADGSKQYTANAGSGGGGSTDFGFGVIYTPNNTTYANATSANDTVKIVGESSIVVFANATTKTITVAGTPGAQGLTVDYGFVADPLYYSIDYGTL